MTNPTELAAILPFTYYDPETGDKIRVSVSPYYSKMTVNRREYFFIRETGEFDGTATKIGPDGPIHDTLSFALNTSALFGISH